MNFRKLKKVWIVAEIGVNHEGDPKRAADLIRSAADCGVDAVKFQTYRAERYISSIDAERFERAKKFQLSYDAFRELSIVARDAGVVFFSTPLHNDDVDFLNDFVPLFKISSGISFGKKGPLIVILSLIFCNTSFFILSHSIPRYIWILKVI